MIYLLVIQIRRQLNGKWIISIIGNSWYNTKISFSTSERYRFTCLLNSISGNYKWLKYPPFRIPCTHLICWYNPSKEVTSCYPNFENVLLSRMFATLLWLTELSSLFFWKNNVSHGYARWVTNWVDLKFWCTVTARDDFFHIATILKKNKAKTNNEITEPNDPCIIVHRCGKLS